MNIFWATLVCLFAVRVFAATEGGGHEIMASFSQARYTAQSGTSELSGALVYNLHLKDAYQLGVDVSFSNATGATGNRSSYGLYATGYYNFGSLPQAFFIFVGLGLEDSGQSELAYKLGLGKRFAFAGPVSWVPFLAVQQVGSQSLQTVFYLFNLSVFF